MRHVTALLLIRESAILTRESCVQNRRIPGYRKAGANNYQHKDFLTLESGDLEPRSKEYCSYIIEALESDKVFRHNGNVINDGYIKNLPNGCCVEVPMYTDRNGLHPLGVGELPPQLAAANQSNVTVQLLAADAAIRGDPELAFAAVAMDPLTSAVLTMNEIREMTADLFEAHKDYLPQFAGKKLRKTQAIIIPKGTVGVETPLDPALSIVHRFGKLATG